MKKRNISFGYQFENGKIIRHPAESRIVNNIFEDYICRAARFCKSPKS